MLWKVENVTVFWYYTWIFRIPKYIAIKYNVCSQILRNTATFFTQVGLRYSCKTKRVHTDQYSENIISKFFVDNSVTLFKSDKIFLLIFMHLIPAGIYLFKVNNGNTRRMCEICSKLTIKTPERLWHWRRSVAFIVNFERIAQIVIVFPLLTFNN